MNEQMSGKGPIDPWYRTRRGEVNRIVFHGSPAPTLGMELELQVVDPESGALVSGGPAIMERLAVEWVKQELLQSTVEINIGPCTDIGEARDMLTARLRRVLQTADELGYGIISAGTHPFAGWESQKISDNPRYQYMLDRIQWPVRRMMIFGLHVHVGVSSDEKAIAISNSLTTFLPHLLALSASSPYWHGEDTGMASVRVKIFEALPSAGLPYRMVNWSEFQRFMNTLIRAQAINSIREVWWDVRPHPVFGTVEVRVADALPTIKENLALAALVQCLVARLSEMYDCGELLPVRQQWVVAENKWRAARWAREAMLICDDDGEIDRLDTQIEMVVESLVPTAANLRCENELLAVREMLQAGASFERQRRVVAAGGSLSDVVKELQRELRQDDVLESI